jgi:hypothetical protein
MLCIVSDTFYLEDILQVYIDNKATITNTSIG